MLDSNQSLTSAQRICPVTGVTFKVADPGSLQQGVIARCEIHLHGTIAVRADIRRRKEDGRPYLAFPRTQSRNGTPHPLVRPLTKEIHAAIERQVFHQARALGNMPDHCSPDAA